MQSASAIPALSRNVLAVACMLALAACGGGSNGNVRASTTSTSNALPSTTATIPATVPVLMPAPTAAAANVALPKYSASYNQLIPTNVLLARQQTSLDGTGVKIGVIDTGAQSGLPALSGQIADYKNYAGQDTTTQDANGHGSIVSQVIAGIAAGSNRGGVAPGAKLYEARIFPDSGQGSEQYMATGVNDFLNEGVRLFNVSGGDSGSITQSSSGAAWESAAFSNVLSKDALVVVAAGNYAKADPSQLAGLPYVASQYAGHWIAVVNVALDGKGNVTGLDTSSVVPSNACGVAAKWCLAAPGTVYMSAVPGTEFKNGSSEGTSNSAPIVTGVAALVWQAFPWMSPSNVQQSILGTATSLGDPSLYGYGMVNAAKAVQGPALLDWGNFSASVYGQATFGNDMRGGGSLTLVSGQLNLTGHNTYTGGTTVAGGELVIQGNTTESNITVSHGGALFGINGVVKGAVASSGIVSTSGGALSIDGNYTAAASSTTAILVGTPLQVSGQTTLQGGAVSVLSTGNYVAKSVEPLIQSAGGLSGTFSALSTTGSVYTSGVLSYTANEADVALTRVSTAAVAAQAVQASPQGAANITATANNIDSALTVADTWSTGGVAGHEAFLAGAAQVQSAPTYAAAATSIDSLSGQLHSSSVALTLQQGEIVNKTLANRLTDGTHQAGAWAQVTGSSGDVGRTGYATGKFDGGGGVMGVDRDFGDAAIAGIALDWNNLNATYDHLAGTSNTQTTGVSLYGRMDSGAAYVLGRAGYSWIDSRVNRYAVLGDNPATSVVTVRTDAMLASYVEAGFRFGNSRASVAPFAALAYDRLDVGSFAEHGADGWGLMAHAQRFDQVNGQLGARAALAFTWLGGESHVSAYALWQANLAGQDTQLKAAYVGAPMATFTVNGAITPAHSAWLGVGWTHAMPYGWSTFLNIDVQTSGGPTKSRNLTAGVRKTF